MERTEKGGRVLENLNHAKELGTPLTNFATAFKLNVNDLYAARRSCAAAASGRRNGAMWRSRHYSPWKWRRSQNRRIGHAD